MDTLFSLFETQARCHADRPAVTTPDARLTYGELDRLARRVAAALVSALGPGSEPVALLMDQDTSFMAAMLGILGAGKIFAPLDPVNPPGRLGAMLADLGSRLLITDERHLGLSDTVVQRRARVVRLSDLAAPAAASMGVDVAPAPEDLAWIIYTSGSTGQPKGVAQDHRRASLMVRDYARLTGITHEDRLTLLHPFHTWDIFGALTSGAGLFPFDLRREGFAGVADWVARERITIYRSFPTTYRRVMDSLGDSMLNGVRLVHLSGETITPGDVELFRRHFGPGCELLVVFGSNEAGLITSYRIQRETATDSQVPVGFPLAGVELQICDDLGEPVARGDTGEIVVRSPHVCPGYWRNPTLTSAAFRQPRRPQDEAGGSRTFFTGDMGSLRRDGCLLYAGRKDFQVKVAGYRIELAEIEGSLRTHPSVSDAVVAALDLGGGQPRLVAYVAPRDATIRARELRSHLADRLPEYMQPERYVFLAELPLTGNGKVDRQALPPPDRARPDLETPYEPPLTSLERRLADLFAEVLELDQVGLHDAFIELGGKSLAAVRILAAISRDHGLTIDPQDFFDAATVAGVAHLIVNRAAESVPPDTLAALLDEIDAMPDEEVERVLLREGHEDDAR